MTDVVEVHGLAAIGAGHAFNGLVEHFGERCGPFQAVLVQADWSRLEADEVANQTAQRGNGTASLAAGDGFERLLLLGACAGIGDDADGPIAFAHLFGSSTDDDEVEPVELDVVVSPLVDVVGKREHTPALGRPRRQVRRDARAQVVTAARFEVFAADLPGHHRPPFTSTRPSQTGATPWPTLAGRRPPHPSESGCHQRPARTTRRAATVFRQTPRPRSGAPS